MKTGYLAFLVASCIIIAVSAEDYVVCLKPGADRDTHLAWANTTSEVTYLYNNTVFHGYAVHTDDPTFLQELMERDDVMRVDPDDQVFLDAPEYWGLDRSNQRDLPLDLDLDFCDMDGSGVDVYVIDSGVWAEHPGFGDRVSFGINLAGDGIDSDCQSHGTHVAGTVASTTHGMAPGANIIDVKVFSCSGGAPYSRIIAAVEWVIAAAAKSGRPSVINMSLGGGAYLPMDAVTNAAVLSGIHVAVSAGNSNYDACFSSPAGAVLANTVGSSTHTDARSGFSNYGECVDLFAPGSSITSLNFLGGYSVKSGTSMAAPHVAGAIALMLSKDPTMTPAQVSTALKTNASENKLSGLDASSPNLLLYVPVDDCLDQPPLCHGGEHGTYYCLAEDPKSFVVCVWGDSFVMPTAEGTYCCQDGLAIYMQNDGMAC